MFIVDNDMMISDKLPTAVDYTNILVNYLEVSYDDVNQPASTTADKPTDTPAPTQDQSAQPPQPLPETAPIKPPTAEIPNTKIPLQNPRLPARPGRPRGIIALCPGKRRNQQSAYAAEPAHVPEQEHSERNHAHEGRQQCVDHAQSHGAEPFGDEQYQGQHTGYQCDNEIQAEGMLVLRCCTEVR
jgi:hypothetical protein